MHSPPQINLNADIGEGFGAYSIGHDDALLKLVNTASIACGFHAGDPCTMHHLVREAVNLGVEIGAHPGFNDLWGFGRRPLRMSPVELEYLVAYQIAAMKGMASYGPAVLIHVKPHGALYTMAAADAGYAQAIARAIKTIDGQLFYVGTAGSEMEKAAEAHGLGFVREGFCDRRYGDDGQLLPRERDGAVITDPEAVAAQALSLAMHGSVRVQSGRHLHLDVDTLCIHGDTANAVENACAVKAALEKAGVQLVPLRQLARYNRQI